MFYFNCGIIGHNEEFYPMEPKSTNDTPGNKLFGIWLRSSEYEKKVKEDKEKIYSSYLINSPNFGEFRPIPEAMLKTLGNLQLSKRNQDNNNANQGLSTQPKLNKDENLQKLTIYEPKTTT